MYPSPPLPGLVNVAEIYGNTAEMTTLHRVCLVGNTPGDAQWTSSGGVGQIEGTHRVLLEDSETKATGHLSVVLFLQGYPSSSFP